MAMAFTSTAIGSPLAVNGLEDTAPGVPRATNSFINAPLTDWMKNGNTDLQWYTTIAVGTPPQNFTVLIDTGSHALLLPQNNCSSCSTEQSKFNPTASSTFSWSPLGAAEPGFSTGGNTVPLSEPEFASCNWAEDDVSIQGLTAPSLSFLLCYAEGEAMTSQPGIDGILGLSVLASQPSTLQWGLYNAGLLDSGVFGLYTPPGEASGGQLTLGGIDESTFEGDLVWLPLDPAGHTQWSMDMQTIFINGEQLTVGTGKRNSSRCTATPYPQSLVQVLDSGTAFIIAPDNATAAALYAQISPKIYQIDSVGTWGCSCEDMDAIVQSGAEISFLLGYDGAGTQMNATIPSSVFNLGPYPAMPDICQAVVNNWQGEVYYNGLGLWTLGSPLLKNYYTAWDGLNLQVGFAPLKSSQLANSSSTKTPMTATVGASASYSSSPTGGSASSSGDSTC